MASKKKVKAKPETYTMTMQQAEDVGELVQAALSVLNYGYDQDLVDLSSKVNDVKVTNTKTRLREAVEKAAKAIGWEIKQ